jgi:hypothetical protein
MGDAQGPSPEQRRAAADALCAQVREWMEDPRNSFRISVVRGMESRVNRGTGFTEKRPNGTLTLQLEINGGAQDTAGPGVLPFPSRIVSPE